MGIRVPIVRSPVQSVVRSPVFGPLTGRGGGGELPLLDQIIAMSSDFTEWSSLGDLELVSQDAAGTTPVTADGQDIGLIQSRNNASDADQSNASLRPEYSTDGTYRWFTTTASGGETIGLDNASMPNDASIFFAVRTTDDGCILLCDNGTGGNSYYLGRVLNGNANAPAPLGGDHYVDGDFIATRGALYDALSDGEWHVIEVRNIDLSPWAGIYFSGYAGQTCDADYGPDLIVIPTANLTSERRAIIIAYIVERLFF